MGAGEARYILPHRVRYRRASAKNWITRAHGVLKRVCVNIARLYPLTVGPTL
jgi:hypothetical protein